MSEFIHSVVALFWQYADILWDYVIGVLFWAAAALLPFRKLHSKKTWFWDLIGLATAFEFASWVDDATAIPLDWLAESSLLAGWYGFELTLSPLVASCLYLVASDFFVYWAHRSMHSRRLWQVHAWHHAPEHLYWIAGLRGSLQDTFILFAPYALAFAIFPVKEPQAAFICALIVGSVNAHLIHSNLRIPCSRQIERVFVTSRYHFVHHAANKIYGNSNYGKMFSWWDRLFGTYTDPDTVPADQPLGLGYRASEWKMMLGMKAADTPDPDAINIMQAPAPHP